jgi:hypothetical protein
VSENGPRVTDECRDAAPRSPSQKGCDPTWWKGPKSSYWPLQRLWELWRDTFFKVVPCQWQLISHVEHLALWPSAGRLWQANSVSEFPGGLVERMLGLWHNLTSLSVYPWFFLLLPSVLFLCVCSVYFCTLDCLWVWFLRTLKGYSKDSEMPGFTSNRAAFLRPRSIMSSIRCSNPWSCLEKFLSVL